jgi:hypothetical protein
MEVNMYRRGSIFLRVLGVLILVGILLAGGALLFRAGQTQGYQMGAAAASQATSGEMPGTAPVVPYGSGYWSYYPGAHFGFFPFFPFGGLCGSILLVLLVMFALRLIFRPRGWFYHDKAPGGWGPHSWGPPPWMRDQPQAEPGPEGAKTPPGQTPSQSPT